MKEKLQRRLQQLESKLHVGRDDVIEQIQRAAVAATSTEDLELLSAFHDRGALYPDCTAEEQAAWERYVAHGEAAALKITGQPLSHLCL